MTARRLPHGGDPAELEDRFPRPAGGWLDLSTGINPHPYPLPDMGVDLAARLPDSRLLASLSDAARAAYGVTDENAGVACGPGSQAIIQALPRLVDRGVAAVLRPTYGEHMRCWAQASHSVMPVTQLERADSIRPRHMVVGQPNNPDGQRFRPEVLRSLADRMAEAGGILVVDEAFCDFEPEISLAPWAGRDGLVVLRSLGKSYGLAGLRLGFALGPQALMDALAAALGPWAVSTPAAWAGTQVLVDADWRSGMAATLGEEIATLDRLVAAYGLVVTGGTALFRLVRVGDGPGFRDRLAEQGVAVRAFSDMGDSVRIGLPADEAGWQRLDQALAAATGARRAAGTAGQEA